MCGLSHFLTITAGHPVPSMWQGTLQPANIKPWALSFEKITHKTQRRGMSPRGKQQRPHAPSQSSRGLLVLGLGCRGLQDQIPVSTLRSVGIPGRNANKHSPSSRLCLKDRNNRWHPRRVRKHRMFTDESGVRAGAGA